MSSRELEYSPFSITRLSFAPRSRVFPFFNNGLPQILPIHQNTIVSCIPLIIINRDYILNTSCVHRLWWSTRKSFKPSTISKLSPDLHSMAASYFDQYNRWRRLLATVCLKFTVNATAEWSPRLYLPHIRWKHQSLCMVPRCKFGKSRAFESITYTDGFNLHHAILIFGSITTGRKISLIDKNVPKALLGILLDTYRLSSAPK